MQDTQNTISPDLQEHLDQQFADITSFVNNEDIEKAAELLLELHYADLADFLDNTNRKYYDDIFPAIAQKMNPEVIACLSDANKQPAVEALGINTSALIINKLDIEDAIEIIEHLDADTKQELIDYLDASKKQQILEGFRYPENTAGRVLEKDFVSLKQHWTAGQAIDYIRRSSSEADFHAAIVVNSRFHPTGTILLSTLLKSSRNTTLSELMNKEFKVADTNTELDDLAFIFKQYALTIVPVTNKQGKLVGSISIDNMLYIVEEQNEAEFLHLGGVNNGDVFDDMRSTATGRFPWLFVNLVTACLTSLVIDQFSGTIVQLVTLATIMPIVASMGGNAGTQVMTVTVRALANRDINNAGQNKLIYKEIAVCAINGLVLSVIGCFMTYILFSDYNLSIIFAVAVVINFVIAGFLGSAIPITINKMDIDPATASGVFLTACTDAIGFFSFLSLAYFFLI